MVAWPICLPYEVKAIISNHVVPDMSGAMWQGQDITSPRDGSATIAGGSSAARAAGSVGLVMVLTSIAVMCLQYRSGPHRAIVASQYV